jgi:endonuclease-3
MAAAKSKTPDKSKVLARLLKLLKKEFGGLPKREQLPVLEAMVFSACLENSSYEAADASFARLKDDFFDWNEVRVSTISELEPVFEGVHEPKWCAMRVRYLLYYVFDHQFSYDFDGIKKKPFELAFKQVSKIKHLTAFCRNYLLQKCLGNHVIPVDDKMIRTAIWLGLVPVGADEDSGPELLKGMIRKADAPEFIWLLKSLSVSKHGETVLEISPKGDHPELEFDIADAEVRVKDVLSGRARKRLLSAKRTAEKKAVAEQAAKAAEKATRKKAAARNKAKAEKAATASKTAAKKKTKAAPATKKKTAVKPPVKKKTAAKSVAKKKTAVKKKTASKSAAKKTAPKKKTVKKKGR